jgi:peptidoglycan/xylan/chitin deacetylase (PgdA/CDA1 family)
MLQVIKQIIAYLLIKLHFLRKDDKNEILSIFFHSPSKKLFDKILKWLFKNNYKIISLEELNIIINQKLKIEKLAIITFDDGWKKNLELLDSIEQYKVPVAIFIPTEAIESGNYWFEYARLIGQHKYSGIKKIKEFKNLSTPLLNNKIKVIKSNYELKRSCITLDELKKINENKLITIGSHTITHPILKQCSIEMQEQELSQSKAILSKWLGREIEYFAFPNGDFDENTIRIAKSCNYKLCFTTKPGRINVDNIDPFRIPRYCIDDKGGYFESVAKILGIWQKYFPKDN